MKCLVSLFLFLLAIFHETRSDCLYPLHTKGTPAADARLKPLKGRRFQVDDAADEYRYLIGICTSAVAGDPTSTSGVRQFKKNPDGSVHDQSGVEIGQFGNADIKAGTDWIYLEYLEGDKYNSHCGLESRKAVILLTCDPEASVETAQPMLLEENTNKSEGCYYLFEFATPEICPDWSPSKRTLSVGSIVLIVFFCVAAVYLIAGALYQRFVLGAKGIEQIPNYEFWKDFGNLQADGCDLVCRTHDSRRSSPYKGLGDDQLDEPEERDDNLLPM